MLPTGIMAGDAPFVCSNLEFSNEIVIARRHTKNIDNINVAGSIFQKVANAIGQLRELSKVKSNVSKLIRTTTFPLPPMTLSFGHSKMVLAPRRKLLTLSGNGILPTMTNSRIATCTLFTIPFRKCGRAIWDCCPIVQLNFTPYLMRSLKNLMWWRFNPPHSPLN